VKVSVLFKSFCIMFSLLIVMGCNMSGDGGNNLTPDLILTKTSHDFSGVVVNNSTDHSFEIGNNGDTNLNVGQISGLATPFSIPAASDACSNRILGPLEICSFEARFEPTGQGIFSDQVSIPSNDPNGTARIDLSGEGYGLNVWIKKASTDPGCVVPVGVTVTDDAGNILDTVALDPITDFFFNVDNIPAVPEDITFEAYETPSPVSVVLAIDTSTSESGVLAEIKNAATSFINQLDDADEAAICSFNNSIEFGPVPDSTFYDLETKRQDLIDFIDTLTYSTNTRLYDAVYESIDRAADGIATNKHLVVVLSDGVDTSSDKTLNQAITYGNSNDVAVFTIYYRDPDYEEGDYGDPNTMERLADGTGGQSYDGTADGLDTVYYKIVSTIRNMFLFELTVPGCTPGTSSLDVWVDTGTLYGKDSTIITFP